MTGPAGWAASGAAAVVFGLCVVALHHLGQLAPDRAGGMRPGNLRSRLLSAAHPQLHRLVIIGMLACGAALATTPLGQLAVRPGLWADAAASPKWAPFIHGLFVIGAVALLAAVVAGFIRAPVNAVAWTAFAFPFFAAVVGGHLHAMLGTFPVVQWCIDIARWLGG